MIFTAPLGLLALLAIPAIIGIHLFRRRFRPRRVAGLFLWNSVRQIPEGGGKVTTLPITTSLILECLAALALALIIAGARIRPAGNSDHLVVLLDDSASMAAVDEGGESSRDRAVRRILAEMERLGSAGRVTLVRSGERPAVLLGPASLALEARAALEKWRPQATHHSIGPGLRFARELAGNTGRLMIVSDVPPKLRGLADTEGMLWVATGKPLANIGITGALRTLSPEQGQSTVSLTLVNASDSPAHRSIRVIAADKELLSREVDLPVGTSSLNLPLPTGIPAVRVSLSDDALRRDNEVTLVEPRPQIVGVEDRLKPGRGRDALEKALRSAGGITESQHPHLIFASAGDLDSPAEAGVWRVGFGTAPPKLRDTGDARDFIGPFTPEKRHPLLQGVTLAGVVWTGAAPLSATLRPLVSAGDQPLIAFLPSSQGSPDNGILFNLDLDRTNLIRAPDWPILISNIVEMRRRNLSGPERWNYRVGEWIRVRLEREPKGPLHIRLGDVDRQLQSTRSLEFVALAPGGLLQIMDRDETLFELGVNFLDEDQTNLRDKFSVEAGKFDPRAQTIRAENGPASDPIFWILLSIAGAAVLSNWSLLQHRRSDA